MKFLGKEKEFNREIEEYYLCPTCGNIYQVKGTASYEINRVRGQHKPIRILDNDLHAIFCRNCDYYAFRCDKSIIEHIRSLNLMGLYTWVCCGGHADSFRAEKSDKLEIFVSEPYIGFCREYPEIKRWFDENKDSIKYWKIYNESYMGHYPTIIGSYTIRVDIEEISKNLISIKTEEERSKLFSKIRREYLAELGRMINDIKSYGTKIENPIVRQDRDKVIILIDGKRYKIEGDCLYEMDDQGKYFNHFYKLHQIARNLDKLESIKDEL